MQLQPLPQLSHPWPDFDRIDPGRLTGWRHRYENAAPFAHLVVDDLFPKVLLTEIHASYDHVPLQDWHVQDGPLQVKKRSRQDAPLPSVAQSYFDMLSSGPFSRFLTAVTGIQHLVSDPALLGGGLHEVREGGHFQVHVDFQTSPATGLANRLAVITYLNPGWTEADGGLLELWDQTKNCCAAQVVPVLGRTVIMKQSDSSLHGHPKPVRSARCRRTLIAYFYTNGRERRLPTTTLDTSYLLRPEMALAQKAEILLRPVLPPFVTMSLMLLLRSSR